MVMTTVSLVVVHAPLLTDHSNSTVLGQARPVKVVVAEVASVMVAAPDNKVHVPVPLVGTVAANVVVVASHKSWSVPASAAEGFS